MKPRAPLLVLGMLASSVALGGGAAVVGAPGQSSAQVSVREGRVTTTDGVELYYRVVGEGQETVLVPLATLHGDRLDALAGPDRQVVLFDPRNRGRSGAAELSRVSLDRQIDDVEAIREAVGAERVDLIGWSGLGMELWAYVLRHPDRVRRFVQLAPVPPRQEPWIQDMIADRAERLDSVAVREFLRRVEAGEFAEDPAERCRASNQIEWAASFADPAGVADTPDVCAYPNEWGVNLGPYFEALLGSFGTYDWRPTLDSVPVPRLVVHGARDNIPLEGNMEWVRGQPNARVLVIEGAGHWPHYERPDRVIEVIATFLDGG